MPSFVVPIAIAVVVLGVIIGVIAMGLGKKAESNARAWMAASWSLWTGGEDSGTWEQQRAVTSLANWYGAANPGTFWKVIEGLRKGQTGNAAWDIVRAFDLLRIGFAAKYVDDDQFLTEGSKMAVELQSKYSSWDELSGAFEKGMNDWQRSRNITDEKETGRVKRNQPAFQTLAKKVGFKAKLVADD